MKKPFKSILMFFIAINSIAQSVSIDASFNPGGIGINGIVKSTNIQADGKIIVAGHFTSYNGISRNKIARLNSDGSLDLSFDPALGLGTNNNQFIFCSSIQADGKIIIGGNFTSFNDTPRSRIARLNPDGSLDVTFNPGSGFNNTVEAIRVQVDGKIVVVGQFTSFNGITRNRIVRLNADGSLDATFNIGNGFNNTVRSLNLQVDGKILVGGQFTSYNGVFRERFARINTDGSPDALNPTSAGVVDCISIQEDNKIIVGGDFTEFGASTVRRIARLNANGTAETTFLNTNIFQQPNGFNNLVKSISIQGDGKIIVGGQFTDLSGTPRNRIARLNAANGLLDTDFDPGIGFNNSVFTTSIQSDGKIIVGGQFTSFDGTTVNNITRLVNCN
jgi:uncharacterized delta-60 repeat protein